MVFDDIIKGFEKELDLMFNSVEYREKIRMSEAKDAHIELALPGVKRQDITVKFQGDLLQIAYTPHNSDYAESTYYRAPALKFDQAKTTCKYEDGLLTIDIPVKTKPSEPEIKIEVK